MCTLRMRPEQWLDGTGVQWITSGMVNLLRAGIIAGDNMQLTPDARCKVLVFVVSCSGYWAKYDMLARESQIAIHASRAAHPYQYCSHSMSLIAIPFSVRSLMAANEPGQEQNSWKTKDKNLRKSTFSYRIIAFLLHY